MTKVCTKCKVEKGLAEFYKDGHRIKSQCKICEQKYNKEYNSRLDVIARKELFKKSPEGIAKIKAKALKQTAECKARAKTLRQAPARVAKAKARREEPDNKAKRKEVAKIRSQKQRSKDLRKKLRDKKEYKDIQRAKRQTQEHKDKNKAYMQTKAYIQAQVARRADPVYKLKCCIRTAVGKAFRKRNYKKDSSTHEILGCSYAEFYAHLEMTCIQNYGISIEDLTCVEIHIDHIIPMALAATKEDVIGFNHFSNLQILTADDNSDKLTSLTWKCAGYD